ncbi:MAG: four helix bundle protein [Candidatus Magasanikbacteria bacterium CG_4_10_14_0_2_um_filter_37_12]|uniref:Four helix bundle protein n=1 Tax=Candidatus Magasanikbacteria bacterium CG_4_10_14_0_2_um_filter_37_12 TaxID=1974637 RepID=A0A2M7V8J7_9BACT|nr:MAG: four helix bundle protein [Candidatus Magasanikbacteria bacterium CG_4_10_14_0_2_um_filter_37_12]
MCEVSLSSQHFPKEEIYWLTSQLCRANTSVFANIAEGNGRKTQKDFLRFLYTAKGSLFECECFLEFFRNIKYITLKQYQFIENKKKRLVTYYLNKLPACKQSYKKHDDRL